MQKIKKILKPFLSISGALEHCFRAIGLPSVSVMLCSVSCPFIIMSWYAKLTKTNEATQGNGQKFDPFSTPFDPHFGTAHIVECWLLIAELFITG